LAALAVSTVSAMRSPPLPALLGVRGQRYFSAALVLLFGATRHGDGADDVATFDDRYRAAPGHDAAVTRHDQALKPRLPSNPRQLLRGLLETGRSVSFVQRDFHRDGAGPVHSAQRNHATTLVDHHRSHGNVQLRG